MSQAHFIRIIALETKLKDAADRIFRLEAAMQALADKPKDQEWQRPTSRKS